MTDNPLDMPFDHAELNELMTKMDKAMDGYSRMLIVLACSRTIAAMFGPTQRETREEFLKNFPGYMCSMWRYMDKMIEEGAISVKTGKMQ